MQLAKDISRDFSTEQTCGLTLHFIYKATQGDATDTIFGNIYFFRMWAVVNGD